LGTCDGRVVRGITSMIYIETYYTFHDIIIQSKKEEVMIIKLVLSALCPFVLSTVVVAMEPISIRRGPPYIPDPNASRISDVVITALVAKHKENEEVTVACDGTIFVKSSRSLRGDDTDDIEMSFYFSLSRGEYVCEGILFRKDSKTFSHKMPAFFVS